MLDSKTDYGLIYKLDYQDGLVNRFEQERYEFYYSETGTHQILDNVKNRVCDLGIIYLSDENETVIRKVLEEYRIVFTELFEAKPHVFL